MDNELTHIHKITLRLWFVSLSIVASRMGQNTNIALALRVWRCAVSVGLFYLGEGD